MEAYLKYKAFEELNHQECIFTSGAYTCRSHVGEIKFDFYDSFINYEVVDGEQLIFVKQRGAYCFDDDSDDRSITTKEIVAIAGGHITEAYRECFANDEAWQSHEQVQTKLLELIIVPADGKHYNLNLDKLIEERINGSSDPRFIKVPDINGLSFEGYDEDALRIVENIRKAYNDSGMDMCKTVNDFVFALEVRCQNTGLLNRDFNRMKRE